MNDALRRASVVLVAVAVMAVGLSGTPSAAVGGFAWWVSRKRAPQDHTATHSRVSRTAALARLAATRGIDTALTVVRSRFSSKERSRQLEIDLERRHAHELVSSLGHMKGALMKIGQMASYIDEGMPPVIRESLATLQQDAPPMESVLAIDVIETELGGRLSRFFKDFDEIGRAHV